MKRISKEEIDKKIKYLEENGLYHEDVFIYAPQNRKYDVNKITKLNNCFINILLMVFRTVICLTILPIILIFKFHFRISGKKNLHQAYKTGGVSVSNHNLTWDGVLIYQAVFPKMFHITTHEENFSIHFIGKLFKFLEFMPILKSDNFNGKKQFIKNCDFILKKKHIIHFMPEGSLWDNYQKTRPFLPGAFQIAIRNNKPIIPIAVCDRKVSKLRKKIFKNSRNITIRIGKPIYPNKNLFKIQNLEQMMNEAYNTIVELREK